jgi:tRNA(Arg) A34 adenosine deaminase TadA
MTAAKLFEELVILDSTLLETSDRCSMCCIRVFTG